MKDLQFHFFPYVPLVKFFLFTNHGMFISPPQKYPCCKTLY